MKRIRIETKQYECSHGHTPRTPRDGGMSYWMFQIDDAPKPHGIVARTYGEALRLAKQIAT